jgi:hypothetical protein
MSAARYACTVSSLAREEPTEHDVLCGYARVVAGYYERYGPAAYDRHSRAVRGVRPQWTVEGGPFTSGMVNKNGQLPYHHDQTNFKWVWSGMLGFRQGMSGGYLAVPAYDLAVEVADKSLTLFDGAAQLHGVTPLTPSPVPPDSWRYTVVYYSRAGMVKCLRPGEEEQRHR